MAKWALVLAYGVAASWAISCGAGDVCEEAVGKLTGECGFGSGAAIDGTIGECVDLRECNAECVVDADCEEIAEQNDPANPRQPNSYEQCLSDCLATP